MVPRSGYYSPEGGSARLEEAVMTALDACLHHFLSPVSSAADVQGTAATMAAASSNGCIGNAGLLSFPSPASRLQSERERGKPSSSPKLLRRGWSLSRCQQAGGGGRWAHGIPSQFATCLTDGWSCWSGGDFTGLYANRYPRLILLWAKIPFQVDCKTQTLAQAH